MNQLSAFFISGFFILMLIIFINNLKCKERYLSLPFAGGDIRSYAPDPHLIEGPLWKEMDRVDSSQGIGDYPM